MSGVDEFKELKKRARRGRFFTEVNKDLKANGWDNGKYTTMLRMLLLAPGVQLLVLHRLQVRVLAIPIIGRLLARILAYFAYLLTSCEISFSAHIGAGIAIPHATGIVIGKDSVVGEDVAIYQQVTLGADKLGEYPVVANGVTLFAGAKLIGGIVIGKGAIVGANAVVLSDVDEGRVAAGVPATCIGSATS